MVDYTVRERPIYKFVMAKKDLERKAIYQTAGDLGISPGTFSGILTGRINPSQKEMEAISEYLGIDIQDLFPPDKN
jgi:transcriptional regulator with XRE-family HTH domain